MADPAAAGFAGTVASAVARTGPLCAGIDPSPALLARWGLPDSADGLRSFGLRCVEAFAGVVPVVKPQVAFFERWGSAGMGALESVMAAARDAGLLVIADAKRGDIGSTMEAYATAWLDPDSPLAADAVTVIPYLGIGRAATGPGSGGGVRPGGDRGRPQLQPRGPAPAGGDHRWSGRAPGRPVGGGRAPRGHPRAEPRGPGRGRHGRGGGGGDPGALDLRPGRAWVG